MTFNTNLYVSGHQLLIVIVQSSDLRITNGSAVLMAKLLVTVGHQDFLRIGSVSNTKAALIGILRALSDLNVQEWNAKSMLTFARMENNIYYLFFKKRSSMSKVLFSKIIKYWILGNHGLLFRLDVGMIHH